jgi:hypothetical protein
MATIGQTLSAARIAAGCSLENLSTRTRIRMQVLRGIENEDFLDGADHCGSTAVARPLPPGPAEDVGAPLHPGVVSTDRRRIVVIGSPCYIGSQSATHDGW